MRRGLLFNWRGTFLGIAGVACMAMLAGCPINGGTTDEIAGATDMRVALQRYQDARLPATARVVQTNRTVPPDAIIMKADELSGGEPFKQIDDLISQAELRAISDHYKEVAGFALKA